MKIVLTGSSGFIGSKLKIFLSKRKYKVINLNLRQINKIDKKNIFEELEAIKNISVIINCAASLKPKKLRDFQINEKLPRIFEQFSKKKMIKFIHISTINVLFSKRLDKYSISKKKGELNLNKQYSTILRLPLIINTKQKKILNQGEISFFYKYLRFIKLPIYPFIYPGCNYRPLELYNLCKYIIKAINQKKNEQINLQGKYQINSFELFKLICNQEKKKYLKINILWIKDIIPNLIKKHLYKSQFFQQILSLDNT